jgi:RNA polymerase sigma-70 factor (ECF subfamily)
MRKEFCVDRMPAAQAVEALSHEYGKLVFHTIYGLTGDWEESQDLTQDTFHQALRSIDAARLTSGEHFHARAWLLSIALNTVRMQRRRRNIFRFIPFSHMLEGKQHETDNDTLNTLNSQAAPVQPIGYGTGETEDPAVLIAEQDAVQRTMSSLAEPFRVCLLLSIVGGLSIPEIAKILDLKEPAVRQRLARARKQFQQVYAQESGEEVFDAAHVSHTAVRTRTQDSAEELNDKHLRLTVQPSTPWRNYV